MILQESGEFVQVPAPKSSHVMYPLAWQVRPLQAGDDDYMIGVLYWKIMKTIGLHVDSIWQGVFANWQKHGIFHTANPLYCGNHLYGAMRM